MNKIKTVFMGTPEFSVTPLEALIKSDFIEVIAVVTNQDKPVGRDQVMTPPPTKALAQKYSIPVLQPDKIRKPEWVEKIKELNPELIIVAAFGQIIPRTILDIPKYSALNIHGSLLPKLRGASPIQFAILEGHKKTGITIMIMDELMDHGPILSQAEIEIDPKETSETLYKKMSLLGSDLLMKTLPQWLDGSLNPQEQNHDELTLTKILKKENGKIIWSETAEKIERQIRAFNPWPQTFCFFKDQANQEKRLKILDADAIKKEIPLNNIYGTLILDEDKNILAQTGDGYLKLNKVQPEGKTPMNAQEFINGYSYLINKNLE